MGELVSSLLNLDSATEEYRAAQGKLQTAYEAAGYSSDSAQTAYREFYKIVLGNPRPVQRVRQGAGNLPHLGRLVGRLNQALNGEAVAKGAGHPGGNLEASLDESLGRVGEAVANIKTSVQADFMPSITQMLDGIRDSL